MEKVRLGIVGVGNVSQLNVPGYLDHPRCDVVALCDSRLERAQVLATKWGVPRVYGLLDDLLSDDEIDAVEILTPTYLHAEHVIVAAQAGKHVSCQKPIATSVVDARRIVRACAEAQVTFRCHRELLLLPAVGASQAVSC